VSGWVGLSCPRGLTHNNSEGCIFLFERKLWSSEGVRKDHTKNCSPGIIQFASVTQSTIRQEAQAGKKPYVKRLLA